MTALDLVGPVAVVTGVSSGIGASVAVALAEAGAHVAGVFVGASRFWPFPQVRTGGPSASAGVSRRTFAR